MYNILVCDDDRDIRNALRIYLNGEGYGVLEAANGKEALDKLATDGTVMKYVAEAGGKAVYQYVELGQHCDEHLHLKCVKCGCIIHLDCGFMDEIAEHIQKDHGFQLQCKNSILYGICKDCRRE